MVQVSSSSVAGVSEVVEARRRMLEVCDMKKNYQRRGAPRAKTKTKCGILTTLVGRRTLVLGLVKTSLFVWSISGHARRMERVQSPSQHQKHLTLRNAIRTAKSGDCTFSGVNTSGLDTMILVFAVYPFSISNDLKLDAERDLKDVGCHISVIDGCQVWNTRMNESIF